MWPYIFLFFYSDYLRSTFKVSDAVNRLHPDFIPSSSAPPRLFPFS